MLTSCVRGHPARAAQGGSMCQSCCCALQIPRGGCLPWRTTPSTEVRKAVCTGLVQMLQLQPEWLAPHMHDIIEYMLASTQVLPSAC